MLLRKAFASQFSLINSTAKILARDRPHSQLSGLSRILGGGGGDDLKSFTWYTLDASTCWSCWPWDFFFLFFLVPLPLLFAFSRRTVFSFTGLGSRLAAWLEFGKLKADSHPELVLSAKLGAGLAFDIICPFRRGASATSSVRSDGDEEFAKTSCTCWPTSSRKSADEAEAALRCFRILLCSKCGGSEGARFWRRTRDTTTAATIMTSSTINNKCCSSTYKWLISILKKKIII